MTRTPIVAAAFALIVLGACSGGSKSPQVATAAGSHDSTTVAPSSETQILHAAAQCIRDHGVPNFPDPVIAADGTVQYDKQLISSLPDAVTHPIQAACQAQLS